MASAARDRGDVAAGLQPGGSRGGLKPAAYTRAIVLTMVSIFAACAAGMPKPAQLDARTEPCAYCRMIVSDPRFASQIVAPYEDPRFFDDLGCLAHYLERGPLPAGAVIYVADHRTREWVPVDRAVFARVDGLGAPMGSHIIAHASIESRQSDVEAASAIAVELRDVLPRAVPAGGPR